MLEIGHAQQLRPLLFDRLDDRRITVTQTIDRDAGEEIEILFTVSVPNFCAPPFDQRDRRACIGLGNELVGQRRDILVPHLRTTSVPTPSLVKISNSTACLTRPSMI